MRRSAKSGNPCTLGLPGGNSDPGDVDLLNTALREAGEEMGGAPRFTVAGEVLTK